MAWRTADPEEWIAASNENGDSGNIPRKYTVPFLATPVTVKATAGFEGEEDMEITCKGAHFEAQCRNASIDDGGVPGYPCRVAVAIALRASTLGLMTRSTIAGINHRYALGPLQRKMTRAILTRCLFDARLLQLGVRS